MPLAGFLTGREQRSNADFRVVSGWEIRTFISKVLYDLKNCAEC